ncbi:MAG: sensor histidine kinase [Paenibacillus sp.]|nr:sensor histidine kinase [Paenibacillus sp.]
MRPTFSSYLNRFQIRLLLFLLLVGSIPLLVAAFVFNEQSSTYAAQEQFELADQSHQRLLERMKQELNSISRDLKRIADDYAVQRYMNRTVQPLDLGEERRLRDYTDMLLKKQIPQNRYLLQMCLNVIQAGQTICSQTDSEHIFFLTGQGLTGKGITPLPADASSYGLRSYGNQTVISTEPIVETQSRTELGAVYMLIAIDRMLADFDEEPSQSYYTIYDQNKRLVYATELSKTDDEALSMKREGFVHSESRIDIPEGEWVSTMEFQIKPNSSLANMRDVLIGLFVLLAMISVGSSILFARHVTKPLHSLRALMKRAELGDLKAYWMDEGIEEINDLGNSYNQMLNRVEELIKQVKLEEALKKEAEMEALQYQLNPHFLYNTLNTIKWVAKIHKTPQISDVVSALVRLLQASLGKKGDFITIREEMSLIRDYMEIQSFRYGERVRIAFEIHELAAGCLVPRMILQPLVENAIIHGIEPAKREGLITIRAYLDRDLLVCEVEDNGVGIAAKDEGAYEPDELIHSVRRNPVARERLSGVGLMHIREKIKLYYGPDFKMFIINKPGQGTNVRMFLPIHQSEEEVR